MVRYTQAEVNEINKEITSGEEALRWALEHLHPRIAKASRFSAEDSVLMDIITKINPEANFFTLDTGRLNPETYQIMDALEKRYKIRFEVVFPEANEVEEMVKEKGINLFYESVENRYLCCGIRKVKPLRRILSKLDGWITGIRRDQTRIRKDARYIEIDGLYNGIIKVNPLLDWSWDDVQAYIRKHEIPTHPLLSQGYPSIGCAPCTRAIQNGEDLRAGRWWWESEAQKECGLHMDHGI